MTGRRERRPGWTRGVGARIALAAVLTTSLAVTIVALGVVVVGGSVFADLMMKHGATAEAAHAMFDQSITLVLLAAIGAAIAAGVVMAVMLGRRLARPLAEIGSAARTVAAGDYAVRVPRRGPEEIASLADSFNQMAASLEEQERMRREFIANAAHQLRTPLATLQVQTELALREPDPVKHIEALSDVLGAVTRLRHVVHQILTLARSDHTNHATAQTLGMVRVDLAQLARQELERWADAAVSRDIDLGYDGPETGIVISGDSQLLHELIGNLVENAIRYGRQGGEVTLRLTESPPTLYIDDDGKGIPAEERSFVVERFYRRSDSGGDGSGLGLAIALEIAARHGALLIITDSPFATGTRVMVTFSNTD